MFDPLIESLGNDYNVNEARAVLEHLTSKIEPNRYMPLPAVMSALSRNGSLGALTARAERRRQMALLALPQIKKEDPTLPTNFLALLKTLIGLSLLLSLSTKLRKKQKKANTPTTQCHFR